MTDQGPGPGWWQAADGNWYPPSDAPAPPTWGPGGGPYGAPAYGGPYVAPPKPNTNAIISLILGIVGIMGCWCFTGIPAIILGRMAKREIAESDGKQTGEGLATAGFILGIVTTVMALLAIGIFVFAAWIGSTTESDDFDDFPPPPTVSVPR